MNQFRQESTERVKTQLKMIIDEKPDEAKYARVVDKHNRSVGGMLGTVSCWTSHNCKYIDENGETIKTIPITTHDSRFQARDTLNFLLYHRGLYKLRYDDEYRQIRGSYEGEINAGIIYPIDNLHSPESRFQRICDYICNDEDPAPVTLTFVCDYDYAETENKSVNYAIRGKIEYKGQETHTRPMWYTGVHMLFSKAHKQLTDNGVEVIVAHDMKKDDADFMMGHHSEVGGLTW